MHTDLILFTKYKTIELLADNIGENLNDFGYASIFFRYNTKTFATKKIQDIFEGLADFRPGAGNIQDKPGTSGHIRKQKTMKGY